MQSVLNLGMKEMSRKCLDPIPPGEILLVEFMKPLHLSINRLARDIDVPPNRISAIVRGKRAITAELLWIGSTSCRRRRACPPYIRSPQLLIKGNMFCVAVSRFGSMA